MIARTAFESTVVFQRIRSLSELRALQVPKQHVYVHRAGAWSSVPGEMLLPGDIFSVKRPSATQGKNEDDAVVPADALLIGGSCICDEAVLTGALSCSFVSRLNVACVSDALIFKVLCRINVCVRGFPGDLGYTSVRGGIHLRISIFWILSRLQKVV